MYNHKKYIKISQNGGMASVPGQMPGATNIPLNGMAASEDPNKAQQFGTVSTPQNGNSGIGGANGEQALEVLKQVQQAKNSQEMQPLLPQVVDLSQNSQQFTKEFNDLHKAMMVNADPSKQTRNPQTGEREPLAQDMAKELAGRIGNYMSSTEKNMNTANSLNNKIVESAKKESPAEDEQKKKTRGNPFKVLMGKIGKLLDHGLGKREITKYLTRQGSWNEETVAKAINIVKDYNKKKSKKANTCFNLYRYSQITNADQTEASNTVPFRNSDIDAEFKPDWTKRSTAELFARAGYLKSVKEFTGDSHSEGRKAADTSGAAADLRSIRAALKKRGFTEEELP